MYCVPLHVIACTVVPTLSDCPYERSLSHPMTGLLLTKWIYVRLILNSSSPETALSMYMYLYCIVYVYMKWVTSQSQSSNDYLHVSGLGPIAMTPGWTLRGPRNCGLNRQVVLMSRCNSIASEVPQPARRQVVLPIQVVVIRRVSLTLNVRTYPCRCDTTDAMQELLSKM